MHTLPTYPQSPPATPSPRPRWGRKLGLALGAAVFAGGTVWGAALALDQPRVIAGTPAAVAVPARPVEPGWVAGVAQERSLAPSTGRGPRIVQNLPVFLASAVAVDPRGSRYYVTGYDLESSTRLVSVHRPGLPEPVGAVPLSADTGTYLQDMVAAPDGRLYVGAFSTAEGQQTVGALGIVDPVGLAVTGAVGLSGMPGPIAVSPDGSRVYVGVGDGVEVVDPLAGRSLGVIALGGRTSDIAVGPDGHLVTVGYSGLKVVDPTSGTVVRTLGVQGAPTGVAVLPDGRHALVTTRSTNSLVLVDLVGMRAAGSVDVGEGPTEVAVAPDGSRALVTNTDAGTLSTIDLVTGAATELSVGQRPEDIAVSADSRTAFVVTEDNVVQLDLVGA